MPNLILDYARCLLTDLLLERVSAASLKLSLSMQAACLQTIKSDIARQCPESTRATALACLVRDFHISF